MNAIRWRFESLQTASGDLRLLRVGKIQRGRREGNWTENITTICDMSRQLYDKLQNCLASAYPPPVANPGVAERAPWRSTKHGVAGVSSLLEMPTHSCHFQCTSDPSTHSHGRLFQLPGGLAGGAVRHSPDCDSLRQFMRFSVPSPSSRPLLDFAS